MTAAAQLGMSLGYPDVISFDMGGTTAKVCVVRDGTPEVTSRFWVGGRYFIGAPVMDMVEIGAGGGSIASIDRAGAVHVGPRSAGSVPGPVCYAKGGTEPTVTDADLVLGYINADYYLGGDLTVDVEAAEAAIKEKIADRLGMSVAEAAHGIYRLVNANMIGATRVITVQRGHDPRDFSLVVSGGTAAIHAVRMAQELRIPRVIVPLNAGVFSAVGLITADARYDVHRSYVARGSQADPGPHAGDLRRDRGEAVGEDRGTRVLSGADRHALRDRHALPGPGPRGAGGDPERAGRGAWTNETLAQARSTSSTRSISTCSDTPRGTPRSSS